MILAFAGPEETAQEAVRRVENRWGRSVDRLTKAGTELVVWPGPEAARMDRDRVAAISGRFELNDALAGAPNWTFEAIRKATGDFAIVAATPDGLLVAPGLAGRSRPIYIASPSTGGVFACTRMEPLLEALGDPPDLDSDFFAQSAVLEPWMVRTVTPYKGVQVVPSGEAWLIGVGRIERERIVRPLRELEPRGTVSDLAALLREALSASLLRASRGKKSVAFAMSGGLDSSALVAIMHGMARSGRTDAVSSFYTWDFETAADGDDRPHVESLTRHLGIETTPVTPDDALFDFRRHMVMDALPCRSPILPFWLAMARQARRDGIDVLVSGDGGDQVMDGRPQLFGDMARHGRPLSAFRRAMRHRGPNALDPIWRLQNYLLRPNIVHFLPDEWQRRYRKKHLQSKYPWAGPRLRRYLEARAATPLPRPSLNGSPDDRYQALFAMPLFDDLSVTRSQEEVMAGHVRRDPLLDDEFLRFVATLPPLVLLHGDYARGLLREAIRGLVPESVRLRETKGRMAYAVVRTMSRLGGFSLVRGLSDVRMMADLGLVEPAAFQKRFTNLETDPFRAGWLDVWAVLSSEAFLRSYAGEPWAMAS